MSNTFGKIFKLTTFGESHGPYIGGIIDGCPAGLDVDFEHVQNQLKRRKPGQSEITTQRNEDDKVEFLSGIFNNKTTGTPIGFVIKNKDQRSNDYDHLKSSFRPSHADFTYEKKYGFRDYRGGGRSSARETACRVVAGAIAQQILNFYKIKIISYVSTVGCISIKKNYNELDLTKVNNNIVKCPDESCAKEMIKYIQKIKYSGDSIGGEVSTVVYNYPIGLGEPVFDKLQSDLAKSMLSINAAKSFNYGLDYNNAIKMTGSQTNDILISNDGKTKTNNSGGIQGGISNGNDIYFQVRFKPPSTIMMSQNSIDSDGRKSIIKGKGRHDPCVLPRAVPIVESMTALVLVDHYFRSKTNKL